MNKKQNLTNKTHINRRTIKKAVLPIVFVMLFVAFMQFVLPITFPDIGIVAYYKLDGVAGDVIDSNEGSNGINFGATRGVPGVINTAFDFDRASSDWVDLSNVTNPSIFNSSTFSISLWFNISNLEHRQFILFNGDHGAGDASRPWGISLDQSTDRIWLQMTNNSGTQVSLQTNDAVVANSSYHLVITYDSVLGNATMHLNATLQNSSILAPGELKNSANLTMGKNNKDVGAEHFDGVMDEFGFWNRVLTTAEISTLYNNGAAEIFETGPIVTLNTLENNDSVVNLITPFNVTLSTLAQSINFTNATISIWHFNDSLANQTTNAVIGDLSNTTFWNITGIPIGQFRWNVLACGTDRSDATSCRFADSNRTFTRGIIINDSFSDLTAFETDVEVFRFNVTISPEVLSVSSMLNYNGTEHAADVDCTGTSCILTSSIDIPLISNTTISQDFFFQTTLFTGSDSFTINLSSGTQQVSTINFNTCNSTLTVPVFNFTAQDEQTSTRIDPFYIAGEFDFWLGSGNTKKSMSFSNTSASELGLCISPPHRTFFIDDTIEYNQQVNGTTYNTRNYYFQDTSVTNSSSDITLFLLNSDDSTTFILKVQDTNLLPIPDAIIEIQRFDVATGNFTIVQIAKTDDNGQSVGFFKTETVDYRFVIKKSGVTLLTTGQGKVVPETAPFTLTFTIGADEGAPWTRFEDIPDLTKSITFNDTTNIVSFVYEDTSGNFSLSRMIVSLQNLSGSSLDICDINSTQASGVLSCDTTGVSGTYIATGFITRGSEVFLVEQILFKIETFSDTIGLLGVFLAFFILLVSAFAFKFNEIAGIVLMNLAVIFVNIVGLVNFGFLFIFGMLGVSIIIIVLLNK